MVGSVWDTNGATTGNDLLVLELVLVLGKIIV